LWFLKPHTPQPTPKSEGESSATSSSTDPEEVERLRRQLDEAEQRIDELQKLLAANLPPQHFKMPVETLDLRTSDEANEIEADQQKLNTEIEDLKTQLAEAQQTIRSQRRAMEDEHGVVHWGQANAVDIGALAANAEAKRKIQELEAASERLREELRQTKRELDELRAGERRKRIEKWRVEIHTHAFDRHPLGTSRFADTETYLEMRPHLSPKTRERFESQVAAVLTFIGPERLRGSEGDKRVLLGEVARIEKEWGVI
jgi:DNA repair exonuclease SbcCD ATPase subunit